MHGYIVEQLPVVAPETDARKNEEAYNGLGGSRDERIIRGRQVAKEQLALAEIEHADAKAHLKQVKRSY